MTVSTLPVRGRHSELTIVFLNYWSRPPTEIWNRSDVGISSGMSYTDSAFPEMWSQDRRHGKNDYQLGQASQYSQVITTMSDWDLNIAQQEVAQFSSRFFMFILFLKSSDRSLRSELHLQIIITDFALSSISIARQARAERTIFRCQAWLGLGLSNRNICWWFIRRCWCCRAASLQRGCIVIVAEL